MDCPYCNSPMLQGFIQCRDGITWTPKRQPIAAFSHWGKGAVQLGADDGCLNPSTSALAHHCPACKMVIIPYGE